MNGQNSAGKGDADLVPSSGAGGPAPAEKALVSGLIALGCSIGATWGWG